MYYWVDYIFGDCVFPLNVNAKFLQDGVYAFCCLCCYPEDNEQKMYFVLREKMYIW